MNHSAGTRRARARAAQGIFARLEVRTLRPSRARQGQRTRSQAVVRLERADLVPKASPRLTPGVRFANAAVLERIQHLRADLPVISALEGPMRVHPELSHVISVRQASTNHPPAKRRASNADWARRCQIVAPLPASIAPQANLTLR